VDHFDRLEKTAAGDGTAAMLHELGESLRDRRRWHALFDLRLIEARVALGLPAGADAGEVAATVRDALDERSLAACREVGWPLLDEGQVAAGWMYLRAGADPAEVAARLAALAHELLPAAGAADADGADADGADVDEAERERKLARLQEIVHVALWEGVDPALGIDIVLRTQGTCNAITAYEQAVSRLPARRQQQAGAVLVRHLHREVTRSLRGDLEARGAALPPAADPDPLPPLLQALAAAGGPNDPAIHVDVSHLQSVLRIARVSDDPDTIRAAWELASYACRLPAEVVYPGEPPFEDVGRASRLFFGARLGHDVGEAVGFFRRAATTERVEESGTHACDALVLLLDRLGRPHEALTAVLERPAEGQFPSPLQASGALPSIVDLAARAGAWDELLAACRARGDEITFAAAIAARDHQRRYQGLRHSQQAPPLPLP
jgi:hypothetical protein